MKGRTIAYGAAAFAGIVLAMPFERLDRGMGDVPAVPAAASPVQRSNAPVPLTDAAAAVSAPAKPPPNVVIHANQGLGFEPLRVADTFVGYVVTRSHDPRLAVGDVVVAVGGAPVEEGAAGGELLIAALRNPDAKLTVQPRTDWSPAP